MSVHTAFVIHEERPWAPTVSWGAVFAGLVLSLIVYLVLSVLGTAIGASAIDPLGDRNPFSGFGVGAGVWAGVTTLPAIAVGGFVAACRPSSKSCFAARHRPRRPPTWMRMTGWPA
ncbi:hypothetical protein [Paracidovorax cattleyae]|uniref:Uncharacterized protein n=1 Tax=Paracidovorax cattleyae TaxID=80868 RepID=A0A1H0UK87_9BURK|nr:hypothetical protein [Paracidovorax cattleyae]SDP66591.1 hypothetical protein SAMN04489708_12063 [Paracidovorax cattleyae]